MDDNRFTRAYLDHKREKEQASRGDNRFSCLRENNQTPIKKDAGRFECLRGEINSVSHQDVRINPNNRFSCLVDDSYQSYSRPAENISYLPRVQYQRPEPRESINERMKKYQEEKKTIAASKPPPPPVFSFESGYHFPELGKSQEIPSNSKIPKPKIEVKLPEAKHAKEMIVNTVIIPDKRHTMTVMCFKNGKLETKEVYEDGSNVPEEGPVILKKPVYTSWASVLKPELKEKTYNNNESSYSDAWE
jgi:hypothetical protein